MIEKIVRDYLDEKLEVPVYMELPKEIPPSYVLVEKTGSSKRNYINSATLAVQSVAVSLLKAAELNEEVKICMEESSVLDEICRATLNSDYNYTDSKTKQYRYQAVYDLIHY